MEPPLFPDRPLSSPQRKSGGAPPPGLQRLQENVTETASRLAILEERLANLRKKEQLTEQNLITYGRETRMDLKALSETLTDLSRKVQEVKETIDAMAGELSTAVQKHEFMVLERYLDLWQPLSFVTREEAKLLIRDALQNAPPPSSVSPSPSASSSSPPSFSSSASSRRVPSRRSEKVPRKRRTAQTQREAKRPERP